MSSEKHDLRQVVRANTQGRPKRRPQNGKNGLTRKNRRRSSRKRQAAFLFPPNTSLRRIEDTDLPVVITSNPAQMQVLERLSTYKSHGGRSHFLPVQVVEPSRVNVGDDFATWKLDGRRIFLLGPDLEAIARQFSRRGAQLYDLNAAAAGGFETLDQCLATEGIEGALEFFDRAERHFKRHVPEGFRLLSDGVYCLAQPRVLESQQDDSWIWICSPIYVKAHTRDYQNQNWGKLIEFLDKDGNLHRYLIPMSALAGQGRECWAQLLSHGLQIARIPKVREMVIGYISDADPEERLRWSSRLGWHDCTFVLPNESIQPEHSEPILYQSARNAKHWWAPSGTREEWINEIGRYCPGNPRLLFAASCAFAPPLLRLTNEPGGGFHFCGASSTGKTTLLSVAASVWSGDSSVRTWRMTANSLDAVAAHHNDGLLCLDELGQADAKEVGAIVYALANGSPKQRAAHSMAPGWNLLVLSSGETGLADYMRTAGKQVHPGEAIRLCDLDADAGSGLGCFDFIHGFANSSAFARHLAESAGRFHGSPSRAFLRILVEDRQTATRTAIELRDQFLKRHVPADATGGVRRVASRFGLVAAAGELATAAGITGWQEDDSMHAAQVCFKSWLGRRETTVVDTPKEIINQVRSFFQTHDTGNIQLEKSACGLGHNLAAGARFRMDRRGGSGTYFVDLDIFRRDVCAGFDPKAVLRILKLNGFLEHDNGRLDKSVRLPGVGKTRVYAIKASILEARQTGLVGGDGNNGDNGDSGDNGSISPHMGDAMGNPAVPGR